MRFVFFAALLVLLAGCGSVPRSIDNACAVFEQRDGLFNNWRRAAIHAQRRYGVPVPILMATIYVESGFKSNARPPRTRLLGFIPWKRPSSAYGFSQALNGTWDHYRSATGHFMARRTKFADAVDFVGWYHRKNHDRTGIALNDPYRLYLAYHDGPEAYARGSRSSEGREGARRFARITYAYARQLKSCPY
jgi:hypothetical protein